MTLINDTPIKISSYEPIIDIFYKTITTSDGHIKTVSRGDISDTYK